MADTILLIDDDSRLLESMAGLLELKGWTVRTGQNENDADLILSNVSVDVVLSDWDLRQYSHLNGGQIVTYLRERHPTPVYGIHSGLDRTPPDGVKFLLKGDIEELLEWLEEQRA